MQLVNIFNKNRMIYLFTRNDKGILSIRKDNNFYPFYYEPTNIQPDIKSYDGVPLRKIIVSEPSEIAKSRSINSYSSDIKFGKNYLLHKVNKIDKCPLKYFFLDIEVLTPELPDELEAKYPISCISLYNSLSKNIQSWYIENQIGDTLEEKEKSLLNNFVDYVKVEQPDLILSWNIDFDYRYLYFRYNKLFNSNFAKNISPISQIRYAEDREVDLFYPAGISILEYGGNRAKKGFFSKIYSKEISYRLDDIALKYLGKGKEFAFTDFSKLNNEIEKRNREDVIIMVNLESKLHIIDYYNEIRILSKSVWEDLYYNSRVIDMFVLGEARKRRIVLPNKPKKQEDDEESFEGAYRRADTGVYKNIYKADVRGMYPSQLVNFCLDTSNITNKTGENIIKIDKINFIQNTEALLPSVAKDLLKQKDLLKLELQSFKGNKEEERVLQNRYDTYKGLVNSLFGITALPSFRLYNKVIASTIAYLAKDLLKYCEEALKKSGCNVIYVDTDALMYESEIDEADYLNSIVYKWAKEKYGKEDIDIVFESEGKFKSLLIASKCRYVGYIEKDGKIKKEIKGMEIKRSSSTKFESKFQELLIDKILNEESKENILDWVKGEKERIKTLDLLEFSFPCKINKEYKNVPIFKRAFDNTKKIKKDFKVNKGELFYYIYVKPIRIDKNNKPVNVLAFSREDRNFITMDRIDWKEVIRRNIDSKIETIFKAIGIDKELLNDSCQLKLF